MLTQRRETLAVTTIIQPRLGQPGVISNDSFNALCDMHEAWLKSSGSEGKQLNIFYKTVDRCDISQRNLSGARIELCDLRFANCENSIMRGAWFYGSDFGGARLTGAEATGATFLSSHCEEAKFNNSLLNSACFMYARLGLCDFSNSSLRKADFERAELYGAAFNGAKVIGVDFTNVFSIDFSLLTNIELDESTKLPNGFSSTDIAGKKFAYRIFDGKVKIEPC